MVSFQICTIHLGSGGTRDKMGPAMSGAEIIPIACDKACVKFGDV